MSEYYRAIDTQATQQQSKIIGNCIEHISHAAESDAGVAEFREIPSGLASVFPDVYLVGQNLGEYTYKYMGVYASKEDADKRYAELTENIDAEETIFVFTGEELPSTERSYTVFWDVYEEDEISLQAPLRQVADLQVRQKLTYAEANIELNRSVRFSIWESDTGEYIINRDSDDPDFVDATEAAKHIERERDTELFITRLMKSAIEKLELYANGEDVKVIQADSTPLYEVVGFSNLLDNTFDDAPMLRHADYEDEFSVEAIEELIQEQEDMLEDRKNGIGLVNQQEASGIIDVLARIINRSNKV